MKSEKEKNLNMNTFKFIFSHCGCANTKAIENHGIPQTAAAARAAASQGPQPGSKDQFCTTVIILGKLETPGVTLASFLSFLLGYTKSLINKFIY